MKNKNVAFMTQAAMIAAIYVVLTCICTIFIRRSTDSYCRSTYDPSGIYTGCNPWTFRWMYCWKYSRRSNSAGYYFRKHCNPDRSSVYVSASQQEPFPCTVTTDHFKYSDRSVRTSLWIRSSTSDSIYDADSWCRRSCRMWCAWISPLYCIESL